MKQEGSGSMPAEAYYYAPDQTSEIDIKGVVASIWRGRYVIGLSILGAVAIAVVYVLLVSPTYRSEVLLAPAEESALDGSLLGQFGGIASIAGLNVGGTDDAEAIAILESRDFARRFIEDKSLLQVFFEDDWDEAEGRWKAEDPEDWPDLRDAFEVFDEEIRQVSADRRSGLVTLAIEWKDPETAAAWANELVARLNQFVRSRDLEEAQRNIEFLTEELSKTNLVVLEQSIVRLMEREMQTAMLARGNSEYVYRVIDRAEPAKKPVKPRPVLMVFLAMVFGAFLGTVIVLGIAARRMAAPASSQQT